MAKKYWRKKIILAKKETVYGTDAVPTEATDAIRTLDFEIEPFNAENVQVSEDKPLPGSDEEVLVGRHVVVRFGTFMAGAGAAGDFPPEDPLYAACGYEGVEDDPGGTPTEVVYTQVYPVADSLTFYCDIDGITHKFTGSRGNFEIVSQKRGFPRINWMFMGIFEPVADDEALDLETVDTSAWLKAIPFRAATVDVELHGQTIGCHSITITSGENLEFYEHSESESIEATDRASRYQMRFEEPDLGDLDVWDKITSEALGALSYTHGTAAGQIVVIASAAAQITQPSKDDEQGVTALSVQGPLVANSGNSYKPLSITYK